MHDRVLPRLIILPKFSNLGQPEAAARQAFAPVLSFLPSFNEVQQRPILAIDVAIDSKPAGKCKCKQIQRKK